MRKLVMIAVESDVEFGASEMGVSFPPQMLGTKIKASIEMMDLDAVNQSDVLFTARSVRAALNEQAAGFYGDEDDMTRKGREAYAEAVAEVAGT